MQKFLVFIISDNREMQSSTTNSTLQTDPRIHLKAPQPPSSSKCLFISRNCV